MGLADDIKRNAREKGMPIVSGEEQEIIQTLKKLFYAEKKPKEELQFLKQLFTRGTENKERVGLHASAMIVSDNEFCVRQQVLSLVYKMDQGDNVPQNLKQIFAEGDAIHQKWQRLFIRGGLATPEDLDFTCFNKHWNLSYTPDAIITIGDTKYVVEIKSVNTYQFAAMEDHPSGSKQLKFYEFLKEINNGFVLAEDKNTQNFKIFLHKRNLEAVAPFVERLDAVNYYLGRFKDENRMVKRKPDCTSYLCKRALKCPMRDACFNRGKGRVKL
jgi:hypothetical protein